jgi:tetratricopeptide (TPR) repeat protein
MLEIQREDYPGALARLDALERLGKKVRDGSELPFARALSAYCRYALGQETSREPLLLELGVLRTVDAKHRLVFLLGRLAELDRKNGHLELAEQQAREALKVATALDRSTEMALARITLGHLALSAGRFDDATTHIEAMDQLMPRASREARGLAVELRKANERLRQRPAPPEDHSAH